ncbi:site-specific integrase [Bradyrhizobium sp. ARR65]|uniref:tyrosine-type recombinase/integrase n=1 Tax=Bradyrhizobium sp. ARR65 TaxID=1040989 RepID=UPI0004650E84|nr:site-specific integrase [Bradyrhizobium sp. ARR65]
MVVRVRLRGLKVARARGKYYVYRRATGEIIIKGFLGSREDLMRRLEDPDLMHAYNRPRLARRPASDFGSETLGGFSHWYTNGDIDRLSNPKHLDEPGSLPDGYPKWRQLAKATRKDYLAAYDYLREDFDMLLADVKQPDLYEMRDNCANRKWPRFADKLISALSSMFKQAVKRGKMPFNPCNGMDKTHEADPAYNREWYPQEWKFARENAPLEVLIPMMLARYAGLRGQTIVSINRKQFEDHPEGPTGKAVRYTPRKNKKKVPYVLLPVLLELQNFLAELKVQRADGVIAVRDDGSLWPSEKEMQTRVSHWLRNQERVGNIGAGTTLHGLRVSYAAWWRRNGASKSEVADLIGDASEAMGGHYTRHVEAEQNITRAFDRVMKDKT